MPFTATRLCAGDFASGGEWQQPSDSACNFDDQATQLCQLPEVTSLSFSGLLLRLFSKQASSCNEYISVLRTLMSQRHFQKVN